MDVICKFDGYNLGYHTLLPGDDYQWSATEKGVYYCRATWVNKIVAWHGYQPLRDASHGTIFWLAKDDGIFLSYDKSSYVKVADWETE
ncbi:hypothetical protein L1049_021411 [Liquidambar formosana]|uniref:Uncharacterized protein n=1 Tax=Liquidambar formosana TaxID=63359 RepID=A0AAP0R2Y9_LIQFO